jgi:hypothetical protein
MIFSAFAERGCGAAQPQRPITLSGTERSPGLQSAIPIALAMPREGSRGLQSTDPINKPPRVA